MKTASLGALLSTSVLAVCAAGCGGSADDTATSEDDVTGTTYVDAQDFQGSAFQGAIVDLGQKLAGEFNAECGDTFCEGDYANLTSLGFSCSVSSVKGSVHECAWVFAGSLAAVDPKTSAITTDIPTFQCRFTPKATIAQLVTALNPAGTARAMDVTLPGTTASIHDGLGDCLHKPIGHTALTFSTAAGSYHDATQSLTGTSLATWNASLTALHTGFDNVCGDTFCGSDYGNLQALDFTCGVTKSGTVGACKWLFSGSYNSVTASTGHITVHAKSFACDVPVKGSAVAFAKVETATGTDNPIQRPLPGATTSAYDALGGCLP